MAPRFVDDRGIALVITLLAVTLFSALGLALSLSSAVDRLAAANHEQASHLLNMADAALELSARDLGALPDWSAVLDGSAVSSLTDGSPDGTRRPFPDTVIDLTGLTNNLTCGRAAGCTALSRVATTAERPWGVNNPTWRPFVYGTLAAATNPREPTPVYVIVWIGDDAAEMDGNTAVDGGGSGAEGRYIVRARAVAFGAGRASRAIEAELARVCPPLGMGGTCLPGARVQSWRAVAAVP